jgi:hypothetical protein
MRNLKLTAAITGAVIAGGAIVALMLGSVTAIAASPQPRSPLPIRSAATKP